MVGAEAENIKHLHLFPPDYAKNVLNVEFSLKQWSPDWARHYSGCQFQLRGLKKAPADVKAVHKVP